MARARYNPDEKERQEIAFMVAIGIPLEKIAAVKGVTRKTLSLACKAEIATGKTKVISAVASSLYKKAMAGNIAAMIFLLKTQGGWKETTVQEHKAMDFTRCTDDELPIALRMFARFAAEDAQVKSKTSGDET